MTATLGGATPQPTGAKSRPWIRPAIGVTIMAVILLAAPVYGALTSGGKIDPAIDRNAETVNVVVDLNSEMLTFHREELAEYGVYGGRDRNNPADRSRARLSNVTQDNLDKVASLFWVERIEPQ